MKVTVDFAQRVKKMLPVHGVNNGPKSGNFMRDSSKWFKQIGIPYSRLHDTEGTYGKGEFVDIPAIFKNFDADPEREENYNFEMTDHYIRSIRECGTKVIYRLGVSIENGPFKKYIYPPKDYRQWARICEGIIRHYTEGWANGMTDGVEYFEIWNEPEFLNHMWIGTYEEFYKLFKDTIVYLKKRFPKVKIGGPATGYTSDEFTEGFFRYLNEGEKAPLDFFSFHTYFTSVEQIAVRADYTRGLLKKYGYENAEIFCTEWNYVTDWGDMENAYQIISDERGAAFAACALCELQTAGYSGANYYDARFGTPFNGLFRLPRLKHHDDAHFTAPKPTFYAFDAFGKLYRLGTEVKLERDAGVWALGATDGKTDGLMIARFDVTGEERVTVELDVAHLHGKKVAVSQLAPDGEGLIPLVTMEGQMPTSVTLPPYSFVLITAE